MILYIIYNTYIIYKITRPSAETEHFCDKNHRIFKNNICWKGRSLFSPFCLQESNFPKDYIHKGTTAFYIWKNWRLGSTREVWIIQCSSDRLSYKQKNASVLKKKKKKKGNCFMATYSRSDPLFQLSCVTIFY